MSLPSLYEYVDHRAYLRDWYTAKKRINPRFSHRMFVRRTGQRSPSLLKDVIEGRRNLTPTSTDAFGRALGLDAEEAAYFASLVHFDQSPLPAERNRAWNKITALRHLRSAPTIEDHGFEYLSHWYYPAIRELATCEGFRADAAWVAKTLHPPIDVDQAERALNVLFRLGLLVEDDGGRVSAQDQTVATAQQVSGLAVHNYYYGMLDRAREAISTVDQEQRHFTAVTVAVPSSLIPELKRRLNEMTEQLVLACEQADDPCDRVVQLNLNFFPLSGSVNEEP